MDDSDEFIEQLLAKERYCFENTSVVTSSCINNTREPSSPHPTLYNVINNNASNTMNEAYEKKTFNRESNPKQPTRGKDGEFEVAAGAYETPLTTPPLTTSNIKLDETRNPIENTLVSAAQPEPALQEQTEPVPDQSITVAQKILLNPQEISDHERANCAEWFLGKPAKTPERYLRIRNHILGCWENTKPNYLNKTAGRKNLSSCGDVNAVGRIHTYLEKINAINVDCVNPVKRVYGKIARSEDGSSVKKAKKVPGFVWEEIDDEKTDEKSKESVIIKTDGKSRPQRTIRKPDTFYNESSNLSFNNDPFTLVPVNFYKSDRSAPFTVSITSESLLVMDFHAHLAYTEIIGLLGGKVVENAGTGAQELKVEYVFPCRSASTGIQCEMDPVSEMQARELFEKKGLSVVGWYHSHPTFEPEPSIRDIENQTLYQELFRWPTGLEPFVGIIITPYNSRNVISVKSQIQIIHISQQFESKGNYRLPFACLHRVIPSRSISEDMISILKNLVSEYKEYEHKIDMSLPYGHTIRMDKLINTMRNHLFMEKVDIDEFLSKLKNWLQDF